MPSKQKVKGSKWERDVAKDFSDLYGEKFIRTPESGARIGGANATLKETLHEDSVRVFKGDIVVPPSFRFLCIECKHYGDFPFHKLLLPGTTGQLEAWLEQLNDTADEADLQLLIFKIDYKGKFIATEKRHLFNSTHGTYYTSRTGISWLITNYEEFLKLNENTIKRLANTGTNLAANWK